MIDFNKKYDEIFEEVFKLNLNEESLDSLVYQMHPRWDSLAQMVVVQRIEDEFCISFSIEEILEFRSYQKGLDLVKNKITNDIR